MRSERVEYDTIRYPTESYGDDEYGSLNGRRVDIRRIDCQDVMMGLAGVLLFSGTVALRECTNNAKYRGEGCEAPAIALLAGLVFVFLSFCCKHNE